MKAFNERIQSKDSRGNAMKAFNERIQGRDSINEGIQRMRSKKGFNEGGRETAVRPENTSLNKIRIPFDLIMCGNNK